MSEENLARRDRAKRLSQHLHASPAQVALAWALSPVAGRDPFVVLGTSQVDHLHELVGACSLALSHAHLRFLEEGGDEAMAFA